VEWEVSVYILLFVMFISLLLFPCCIFYDCTSQTKARNKNKNSSINKKIMRKKTFILSSTSVGINSIVFCCGVTIYCMNTKQHEPKATIKLSQQIKNTRNYVNVEPISIKLPYPDICRKWLEETTRSCEVSQASIEIRTKHLAKRS
jgi:hypothetical protein